jgi:hypothetical protein
MHTLEISYAMKRKLLRLVTRLYRKNSQKQRQYNHIEFTTMFKRVDRRRKRQEQAERLGLDEDEKDILGLHDTDSSESESDSSDSASASSSSTSLDGHGGQKRKRTGSLPSYDEEESENGELVTGDEEDEDVSDCDHGTEPSLTIASALRDPIRLIYQHPEAWACAFCPNKILKHTIMVKVHEASRARTLQIQSDHRAKQLPTDSPAAFKTLTRARNGIQSK